ncbi:MAG: YidC/Oxa1 family membrane protein insertase [Candidatus Falkowbacteria bacterium]|nr:YidC/Oxa1 family membrane protein insertase [Candidatus Falkowbacteria bacterium]
MGNFFVTIFYQPILNLLVLIYNVIPGHDIGLAIIVLTLIVKLILYPLSKKSLEGQKALQSLQPKLEEIKKQYANDKEGLSKAMMELYKKEKVNPLSSCLPLLIQLPFFWAIFRVFRDELSGKATTMLYSFVFHPGVMNPVSFGFINFSKPNIVMAILAGASQFVQAKMMPMKPAAINNSASKDENMMAAMNKQMLYFMPAFTVFICLSLPSGLAFYWLISTLLTILQQWYMFRNDKKPVDKVLEGELVK